MSGATLSRPPRRSDRRGHPAAVPAVAPIRTECLHVAGRAQLSHGDTGFGDSGRDELVPAGEPAVEVPSYTGIGREPDRRMRRISRRGTRFAAEPAFQLHCLELGVDEPRANVLTHLIAACAD